jgi:hypothetical protein
MHIDSYRFEIDNPGWPAFLEAQGFVVLRRLVPDAPDFVAALWDLVEALGDGLDRRVAATQRCGRRCCTAA